MAAGENMKRIFEQLESMKKEYEDTEKRIEKTREKLASLECDQVKDTVKGGMGGIQHYTIAGFPDAEYKAMKTLLLNRCLRLEKLHEKLLNHIDVAETYIAELEDSRKRLIMTLRYVDGLTWRQVAQKLGPGNTEDGVRLEIKRMLEKTMAQE